MSGASSASSSGGSTAEERARRWRAGAEGWAMDFERILSSTLATQAA